METGSGLTPTAPFNTFKPDEYQALQGLESNMLVSCFASSWHVIPIFTEMTIYPDGSNQRLHVTVDLHLSKRIKAKSTHRGEFTHDVKHKPMNL
jgi:hypothetical protein